MDIGVGGYGGADVDADGGGVDEFYLSDPIRLQGTHVFRQFSSFDLCLQGGDQALQDESGLAGAGYAGDSSEPSFWDVCLQRLYGVDGTGGEVDAAVGEHVRGRSLLPPEAVCPAGQEGADHGAGICHDLGNTALSDDMAALQAGLRPHLHDPVSLRQNLCVVVHQYDGIAVCYEVVHDSFQPFDVGGMQSDGGLVQHVEHPGGAVADSTGQLHPLALPGGEGGGSAVQGKVAKAQVHEPPGGDVEGLADTLCHGAHLLRQGGGDTGHPASQIRKRHPAHLIQGAAPQPGRSCLLGEAGPAAVRADFFL